MKKFFTGLLVLLLALTVMPAALAEENEPAALTLKPVYAELVEEQPDGATFLQEAAWDSTHTCYRDQLNEAEKAVYDRMVEVFTAFAADMEAYMDADDCSLSATEVTFSNGDSECWVIDNMIEETWKFEGTDASPSFNERFLTAHAIFQKAGAAVSFDHPEFFWIRQSCSATMGEYTQPTYLSGKGTEENPYVFEITASFDVAFLAFRESDEVNECDELQEELDEVVETLMGELEKLPDTEAKLEYLDNWLAEHNHYNTMAAKDPNGIYGKDGETPWSVVGGLLDDYSPVCEGYAKAFQLICHKLGLPCLQLSGTAKGGSHMWNAVCLDGTWYFCDPTWNDPVITNTGTTRDFSTREYFLIDQPKTHKPVMDFASPECDTNYYDFDAADVNRIIENLKYNPNYTADTWDWDKDSNEVTGYEVGKGTMMVALYQNGKLLAVETCEVAYENWRDTGWNVYSISGIDAELLAQADEVVRFNVDEYVPVKAMKPIGE